MPKSLKEQVISTINEFIRDKEVSLSNEEYLGSMLEQDYRDAETELDKGRLRKMQSENKTLISTFEKDIKVLEHVKSRVKECEEQPLG